MFVGAHLTVNPVNMPWHQLINKRLTIDLARCWRDYQFRNPIVWEFIGHCVMRWFHLMGDGSLNRQLTDDNDWLKDITQQYCKIPKCTEEIRFKSLICSSFDNRNFYCSVDIFQNEFSLKIKFDSPHDKAISKFYERIFRLVHFCGWFKYQNSNENAKWLNGEELIHFPAI